MNTSTSLHEPSCVTFRQDAKGGVLRFETVNGDVLYVFSSASSEHGLERALISLGRQLEQGSSAFASTRSA